MRINLSVKRAIVYLAAAAVGYASMLVVVDLPLTGLNGDAYLRDVLLRRKFIIRTLDGSPSVADLFHAEGEQYAGEWTLGMYGMATYALTNIAMMMPQTAAESSRVIAQWIAGCTRKDIANFDQEAWGESPLDEAVLKKDRGHMAYYGYLNLMLGCYALLNNDGRFKELQSTLSEAIARRMRAHAHRHAETYPFEAYPPDNVVAVASLRVADATLGTAYKDLVDEWVRATKKIECPPGGLVAFQIDIYTGKPVQGYRGSNLGFNCFFLPLIDETYAKEQYGKFKKRMLRRFLGLAAFREYPQGGWFKMDRDTGPVIFGLGGTATIFSVAGARWDKDERLTRELLRSFEVFGVTITKREERRYLAVPLIADAILLAMKTAGPWRALWKDKK